jgi:hypothetical protein
MCIRNTASAVTPGTANGNSKTQRTRTNVNGKKLIPGVLTLLRTFNLGRLIKSGFLFIFGGYLGIVKHTYSNLRQSLQRWPGWLCRELCPG